MIVIDPLRVYEVKGSGVCPVKCAFVAPTVGSNRTFVAAVTGKRIRVMGYEIWSQGAAAAILWKSLNAATNIFHSDVPALATGLKDSLEIKDCGYFETGTGDVLAGDVAGDDLNMNIFYIEYTPS